MQKIPNCTIHDVPLLECANSPIPVDDNFGAVKGTMRAWFCPAIDCELLYSREKGFFVRTADGTIQPCPPRPLES
jgi:hypothetical protein